jgi:hypothetical protein
MDGGFFTKLGQAVPWEEDAGFNSAESGQVSAYVPRPAVTIKSGTLLKLDSRSGASDLRL